jgi:hypothetical protein
VKSNERPLSPDAFCVLGVHNLREHSLEVRQATRKLREKVVVEFGERLGRGEIGVSKGEQLRIAMRHNGINMRYLGRTFYPTISRSINQLTEI